VVFTYRIFVWSARGSAVLVLRGLDPEFTADRSPALRGHALGLGHLSGAAVRDGRLYVDDRPLDPMRMYRVAGTDFEFKAVWGHADETWQLEPRYEVDVLLREALDEYLQTQGCAAAT
jgi:hypothetical protein